MPPNPHTNVNLGNNGVINKELPDDIDKGNDYSSINDQDLTMAYDEVMGGGEEVLLLDISGEDKDMWRDNSEVFIGTYLDIFSKESSKEIKVMSLKEPIKH